MHLTMISCLVHTHAFSGKCRLPRFFLGLNWKFEVRMNEILNRL